MGIFYDPNMYNLQQSNNQGIANNLANTKLTDLFSKLASPEMYNDTTGMRENLFTDSLAPTGDINTLYGVANDGIGTFKDADFASDYLNSFEQPGVADLFNDLVKPIKKR